MFSWFKRKKHCSLDATKNCCSLVRDVGVITSMMNSLMASEQDFRISIVNFNENLNMTFDLLQATNWALNDHINKQNKINKKKIAKENKILAEGFRAKHDLKKMGQS